MIRQDTHLEIRMARDEQDLLAAQRLRYTVFVEELGATGPLVDHGQRLEQDEFDPFFDHLILVDNSRDQTSLDYVVGVYRLLTGEAATRCGRFYSQSEYDLSPLCKSGASLLELGRSCVHPEYRGGMALFRLWAGLAEFITRHDIELLFGVASFHGTDAAALKYPLSYLYRHHLAPPELRVSANPAGFQSMDLVDAASIDRAKAMKVMPSLIKAYLRLGGYVGDGAFIDRAFNTTDVFLLMDTKRLTARQRNFYSRRHQG